MLGTDPRTRGGIAAVIETYRTGGLFSRVPITLISTHEDGSRVAKALRFVRSAACMLRHVASGQIALVHAHVSSRASFWRKSMLLLMARLFGVPTLFHLHSGGFAEWTSQAGLWSTLRRWWVRQTLEASDAVVVLTPSWAAWVSEFASRSRVTVVGNPVKLPALPLTDEDRSSCEGVGRVLFLGWIYDFKGIYDLLQAWVLFRISHPKWKLVVGGKGEVDKFLASAEKLGIRSDVEFLGWVSGEDKERQLRSADIFVLPSYHEGMPVSVLEAMAFGAALITTPVGGVPDMMQPEVHALWVQPGDVKGLADRMGELAASPAIRKRLARAAYTHVATHYSVEVTNASLVRLYSRLTGGQIST